MAVSSNHLVAIKIRIINQTVYHLKREETQLNSTVILIRIQLARKYEIIIDGNLKSQLSIKWKLVIAKSIKSNVFRAIWYLR